MDVPEDADDYIKICEEEGGEFMEFPKETNSTLLLSTLTAQFPNAIGLKYRAPSGALRALRFQDGIMEAPKGGWGDRKYVLAVSSGETNKRKTEETTSYEIKKTRLNPLLQDMAVMNLPYDISTEDLREYFEKHFGDLEYCEVKTHRDTGKSRGYGFIRFRDESCASQAVSTDHHMNGRKVEVRLKEQKPMKLFVGRCPQGITTEDLREHFSKYGELADVFIPMPFRNFAFITYASQEAGRNALMSENIFQGQRLNVQERNEDNRPGKQGTGSGGQPIAQPVVQHTNGTQYVPYGSTQGVSTMQNMDPTLKAMLMQHLATQ